MITILCSDNTTSMACIRLTAQNKTVGVVDDNAFGNVYRVFIHAGFDDSIKPIPMYTGIYK